MKLTLWRQFSSNHSAAFMLVGQFATPALAEEAAQTLRNILARIQAQWQQYPTLAAREHAYEAYVLSPVERQIRNDYQIDNFDMSLDWWLEGDDLYEVLVQRDLCILHSPDTAYSGLFPFTELVENLGGTPKFWSEAYQHTLSFMLTCTLPTLQDIEVMWNQIEYTQNIWGEPLFTVPGVQPIAGLIERDNFFIRFRDVDLRTSRATFEDQFAHFLDFVESYRCTSVEYTFYHTEPDWA